jgi:hypothetical protein
MSEDLLLVCNTCGAHRKDCKRFSDTTDIDETGHTLVLLNFCPRCLREQNRTLAMLTQRSKRLRGEADAVDRISDRLKTK